MADAQRIINLVLKAVALGMGVASIVLGFLPEAADINTQVTLLAVGLFALPWPPFRKKNDQDKAPL
jgi:hypothetical protein